MSDRIDAKQAVEPAQPPLDVDGPDALAWSEEADLVMVGFGGAGAAVEDLSEKIRDEVPEVHVIGDAKEPRRALEAIAGGAEVGRAV